MADPIRLTSIEGGGNWWLTLNWAAEAFRNEGLEIVVSRYGTVGLDTIRRVAKGEADIAICNPGGVLGMALRGRGPFREPIPLRSIMVIPQFDQFGFGRGLT